MRSLLHRPLHRFPSRLTHRLALTGTPPALVVVLAKLVQTMQGTEYEPGIIPRTVDAIFSSEPCIEGRTEVSFSYVVSEWVTREVS